MTPVHFLFFTHFFVRRIIQAADTADEFYCVMGQLSQEMLEYQVSDSNKLIKVRKKSKQYLKSKSLYNCIVHRLQTYPLFFFLDSCRYFTFPIWRSWRIKREIYLQYCTLVSRNSSSQERIENIVQVNN